MHNIIKKQLESITAAKIEFNDDTTHIVIPKSTKIFSDSLKKDKIYKLQLNDSIIGNSPAAISLASNWNNGIKPEYNLYFAELIDVKGKFKKFNCTSVENPISNFYGWLPDDCFEIIEIVD